MVLAKDLHEKIQKMQLQIEGSKKLASIEKELIETNKCISALIDKLEGKEPDDIHKEQEQEEVDNDDTEQDIEEEEEEDPEPDDDDYEEEMETEEQIDAKQECQLKDVLTSQQLHLKTPIDSIAGYNEAKEKQIADTMKAHSRDETYPFTFDNGEGGIDEIFASNYHPIIKRLIYYVNKGYRSDELRIAYLELKCRDKNKYDQLKTILIYLLQTHEKLLNGTYPNLQKHYTYSISKTLFLFKVRRLYFIENLINHYQKLTKLKSDRFN